MYAALKGNEPETPEIMDIYQASKMLGVSRDTIYKMANEGTVPATKVGGSWRFTRSSIDAWLAARIDSETTARRAGDR